MKLIILAGMPATGKSTLAAYLQKEFGFPVIEKDAIKEELFDTIGFECYAEKRQLDVAANAVTLNILERMIKADTSVIVDNNFDPSSAARLNGLLNTYHPDYVTVFMSGDTQVLYERYVERDSTHRRHLGHAMQTHYPPHEGESTEFSMTREGFDMRFLHLQMDKLAWDGPCIRVDATYPERISLPELVERIKKII